MPALWCVAVLLAVYRPFEWWFQWVLTGKFPKVERRDFLVWIALLAGAIAIFVSTIRMN